MNIPVIYISTDLLETACVVIVFAYLITRSQSFTDILERHYSASNCIILIFLFGLLSIYGTYGGIRVPSGAIANIRDLSPLIAGLTGGPLIGLGAGLMGGIHRYLIGGGITATPCAISTVIAGLLGGTVYIMRKGSFVSIGQAALVAAFMEILHISLVILIARPYEQVIAICKEVILPMIAANAAGTAIFAFIIRNLLHERQTAAEKEQYRRNLERREYELETAREIQQSFLPANLPQEKTFELAAVSLPAWEVGGDFYDFIPLASNTWGIVIADVSGKGIPAALFMSLCRTVVRANVMGTDSPAESIERANAMIAGDADSGMFVTLLYSAFDSQANTLTYVNGGHNPALLLRGETGKVIEFESEGIALGVLEDITLKARQIGLARNDMIFFYTDGVTEAINQEEEEFGKERLIELIETNAHLSAPEIIHTVQRSITTFCRNQPQFDDITMVVLKIL